MPLQYPIHQRTLGNGLRVVVSPDRTTPIVAVNLWVGVGSGDEVEGRTGFAHLFEHLMFQGSEHVAKGEHFEALMAQGARLNATTWFDRTNYFETVPVGALDLALWLEADRHGRLLPALTQENLDNQRDVVKEEKRQRYDNAPYGQALAEIYAATFPVGHPYHHSTIGSMDDLDAASLDDVHAFYRRHYGPASTVLTLVGDITPEDGFAAAERYFGSLSGPADDGSRADGSYADGSAEQTNAARPAPASTPPLPPLSAPVHVERVEDVPNDRLYIAFRLPVDGTRDFLAAALALEVLGGLATSRLTVRLVRHEQSAHSVQAIVMGLVAGVSLGLLVVDVADGCDPVDAERQVVEELQRFAAEGPTDAELDTAMAQSERAWLSALAGHDERADALSQQTLLHGDPQRVNTYLDELAAIGADEVRAAAEHWLQPSSRVVLAYRTDQEEAA